MTSSEEGESGDIEGVLAMFQQGMFWLIFPSEAERETWHSLSSREDLKTPSMRI